MWQFCTRVESRDLFKGLALYHSLTRQAPGSVLWVLCLDPASERVLGDLPLPGLRVLPLRELEAAEPALRSARGDRSRVGHRHTCTPALLWHLLTRVPDASPITYLDPGLAFFSGLAALLEESASGSIAILPFRYPPALRDLERYGRYSVSWVTFLGDRPARECLAWWRNRCFEWCHERLERDRYLEGKYLDEWPTRFEGVHVISHEGAGVAPWNVADHPITRESGGALRAGGAPLVFYHFHGLRRLLPSLFDPGLGRYRAPMTPLLERAVYLPYIAELRGTEGELRRAAPGLRSDWGSETGSWLGSLIRGTLRRELLVAGQAVPAAVTTSR